MTSFTPSTTGDEVVQAFSDRVKGKTIVITGPTHGSLGAETAVTLAKGHPARLLLLGRTLQKVEPVIDEIKRVDNSIDALFVPIELDSFDLIRKAATEINSLVDKIDYLLNNAGIMAAKEYKLSKDGYESQLAVNHLGHFLLTSLLMDKIIAAGEGSRIVNTTSNGYMISPFKFDDYNFSNGQKYDMWSAYGQAKTGQVLFARALAKKLKPLKMQTYSVHPGVIITTGLSKHTVPEDFASIDGITRKNTGQSFTVGQFITAQQGISTGLIALLDPSIADESGSYMEEGHVEEVRDHAKGTDTEERLWKLSEQLTGQKFDV